MSEIELERDKRSSNTMKMPNVYTDSKHARTDTRWRDETKGKTSAPKTIQQKTTWHRRSRISGEGTQETSKNYRRLYIRRSGQIDWHTFNVGTLVYLVLLQWKNRRT